MLRLWKLPTDHDLLQQYGRKEVEPRTHAHPPSTMNAFFTTSKRKVPEDGACDGELHRHEALKEWDLELAKVTGDRTWVSFSPESQQHTFAELKLMRHVYEAKNPDLATDCWKAGLVPQGVLLIDKLANAHYYTVRSWSVAFAAWPAVNSASKCGKQFWALDKTLKQLPVLFCFDLSGFHVADLVPLSPVRVLLLKASSCSCSHRRSGSCWTGRFTAASLVFRRRL